MSFGRIIFLISIAIVFDAASVAGAKENWLRVQSDTGFTASIDLGSVSAQQFGPQTMADAIVCVEVDNNTCAPGNMRRWRFDCRGHFTDFDAGSTSMPAPPLSVAGRLANIACKNTKPRPSARAVVEAYPFDPIARVPCKRLLDAYLTDDFTPMMEPIFKYVEGGQLKFGSRANIRDYVLTECRLNESYIIGEAVQHLMEKNLQGRLPRIPIGGATPDPAVHAVWKAFDKWIKHQGPAPDLATNVQPQH